MSEIERELTKEEIDAQVAKDIAEAEKSKAEAEKIRNEAEEARYKANIARHAARAKEIELEALEDKRERYVNNDDHRHVYRFSGAVNDAQVTDCMDKLSHWDRTCPGCDITIVFMSPGGNVISGMALYDYIRVLSSKGHHITTICSGYAASMAGILLQAGDTRVCGAESYILIHEISAATMGKIGDIEDQVAFYKMIGERVLNIFVTRSGGKLSKRVMKKNWTRKDWWIDSDEALKLGIVDEVR